MVVCDLTCQMNLGTIFSVTDDFHLMKGGARFDRYLMKGGVQFSGVQFDLYLMKGGVQFDLCLKNGGVRFDLYLMKGGVRLDWYLMKGGVRFDCICFETHCTGCMNVPWDLCWLCWGGNRSTKPCSKRLRPAMKGNSYVWRRIVM